MRLEVQGEGVDTYLRGIISWEGTGRPLTYEVLYRGRGGGGHLPMRSYTMGGEGVATYL